MPNIDAEPLTLDEIKKAIHISAALNDHDTDLEHLIMSVRAEAEKLCGSPIIATTKTTYLDRFPVGEDLEWWDGVRDGCITANEKREIELPPGKLRSVASLTTYDDSDNATVMSSDGYFVDTEMNRIVLRAGYVWPTVARVANGIKIVAEMGWATPADVPYDLKERMMERLAVRWRHRNDSTGKTNKIDWLFYGPYTQLKFGTRNLR
jgi:hypothetical protein